MLRDEIAEEIELYVHMIPYKDLADRILALIEGQRCEWTPIDSDMLIWGTGCNDMYQINEEIPTYCPCCGRKIRVKD